MAITRVYLTEKGADLLAKAQIGSTIAFTRAEVGEGQLPAGTVITQMTSLVQPVKEIYPSKVTVQEGQATIQLNFTNQGVGRPFFWYEVGVYATDPDEGEILYAYGNAMEAEHADEIPAILTEFLFNVILKVQNTENVTVNVDKGLVYSTQAEFQAHADSKANPHGVTKAQVGLGNVNNTADANKPVSTAQKAAIDAVQANLTAHAEDTVKHVTAAERANWDAKAPADTVAYLGEGSVTGTLSEQAKITTLTDHAGNLVAPRTTAGAVSYGDKTVEGAISEVYTMLDANHDFVRINKKEITFTNTTGTALFWFSNDRAWFSINTLKFNSGQYSGIATIEANINDAPSPLWLALLDKTFDSFCTSFANMDNASETYVYLRAVNTGFYQIEIVDPAGILPTTKEIHELTPAKVKVACVDEAGHAATATKLQTARTINGVAFDGTSSISITAPADGGNAATVSGLSFEVAASAPATVTNNKVTFVYG